MFMSMSEDGGHLMKGLTCMRLKHFHLCLTFMHKLFIVFENDDFAIINKPAGMVVHPTDDGRHMSGTLINALLGHFGKEGLSDMGGELRPGIVHRLDADTSGLMIVAKNNDAHVDLVEIFKNRAIEKKYIALVAGHIDPEEGRIESPLERARKNPGKMHIANEGEGKEAITLYEVIDYLELENQKFTLLLVDILTGRTHQIRVHFNAIGYPVAGDVVYGNKKINALVEKHGLKRQYLHAAELKFTYNGELIHKKSPLPKDLEGLLSKLNID